MPLDALSFNQLHRIDPGSNRVVESIDLGAPEKGALPVTTSVVLAAGSAWVMNGDLVRVDFTTARSS